MSSEEEEEEVRVRMGERVFVRACEWQKRWCVFSCGGKKWLQN